MDNSIQMFDVAKFYLDMIFITKLHDVEGLHDFVRVIQIAKNNYDYWTLMGHNGNYTRKT